MGEKLAHVPLCAALDVGLKAHGLFIHALFDYLVQSVECSAADKEYVGGVYLDELLMWVLAAALGRNVGHGALQELQKRLLHALTGNVSGD